MGWPSCTGVRRGLPDMRDPLVSECLLIPNRYVMVAVGLDARSTVEDHLRLATSSGEG